MKKAIVSILLVSLFLITSCSDADAESINSKNNIDDNVPSKIKYTISDQIIEKTLDNSQDSYDDETYANIHYMLPEITIESEGYDDIQCKINDSIHSMCFIPSENESTGTNGYNLSCDSSCEYSVIVQNDKYFSCKITGTNIWDGFHCELPFCSYITFDIATGELLNLDSISVNGDDLASYITERVFGSLKNDSNITGYAEISEATRKYFFDHISSNDYEFGIDGKSIYVNCSRSLLDPYSKVNDICEFDIPVNEAALFFNDHAIELFDVDKDKIQPIQISETEYIFYSYLTENVAKSIGLSSLEESTADLLNRIHPQRRGLLTAYIDEETEQMVTITLSNRNVGWDLNFNLYSIENGNVVEKGGVTASDYFDEYSNIYISFVVGAYGRNIVLVKDYREFDYRDIEINNYTSLTIIRYDNNSIIEDYYVYEVNNLASYGKPYREIYRKDSYGDDEYLVNNSRTPADYFGIISSELFSLMGDKVSVTENTDRLRFYSYGPKIFDHYANNYIDHSEYNISCIDYKNLRYYVENIDKFTPIASATYDE